MGDYPLTWKYPELSVSTSLLLIYAPKREITFQLINMWSYLSGDRKRFFKLKNGNVDFRVIHVGLKAGLI